MSENYSSLKSDYENLQAEYDKLKTSYTKLQETYDLYNTELKKEVPFEIKVPDVGENYREWSFDIGYGIIVKTKVNVSKDLNGEGYISANVTWTRGGESGILGGTGRAYAQLPDVLEGVAFCEIYDSDEDFVRVRCGTKATNSGWIGRKASGNFPKEL